MTRRVRLTETALAAIAHEAALSVDGRETGGVLLGYDATETDEALALAAGGPGPRAMRESFFFRRDLEHAQALADAAYSESCSRWIGEWHTHPGGGLVPSGRDLRTYRRFLRDRHLQFESFLALIVTPSERGWDPPLIAGWLIELQRFLPALLLPSRRPVEIVGEPG